MPTIIHTPFALRRGLPVDDLALCVDGEYIVDAGTLAELVAPLSAG